MTFRSIRFGFACIVAPAIIPGCAGPAGMQTSSAFAPAARAVAGSHVAPEAKAQPSLLYVSSILSNDVYVYSYPDGKLEGKLTGFDDPYGLCSDAAGDVWIVDDGANEIVEYAHGGTEPIATLSDPGEFPEGCSVDPVTGNLAVTNFYATSGAGSVAIYAHAAGSPKLYSDAHFQEYRFCGYDDKGDLFVDGVTASSQSAFAELARGKKALATITLKQSIEWPGGVSFDGTNIDIGDTDASKVYLTSGKSGNIVGTVSLGDANYVNQFWIVPGTTAKGNLTQARLIAASQDGNVVGVYAYPAGNFPKKKITVQEPFGVTVSTI
jgi:hypothetical protein